MLRRHRLLGSGPKLYYDVPFHPVRALGVLMWDKDGRTYLDAYNNVPHVGHCHPHVVEALCRQARTLNTNTRYLFDHVLEYAEQLVATTPPELDTVLFTCTGSEANDLAWRLARAYTGNDGAVTTRRAYHGNTTFLDSIDGSTIKSDPARASWWATIPPPAMATGLDSTALAPASQAYADEIDQAVESLRLRGHRAAALYIDTYFCADGVYPPPAGFLGEALTRLRKAGALCIADEVQPGLGRNGQSFWGFQNLGISPDIVTSGKPMGNGHPIGALITRREIAEAFFAGDRYFNTFAGNPVSCAAGIAVLETIRNEQLQENAREIGNRLIAALQDLQRKHEMIAAVRGSGLLVGVELVQNRKNRTPAGKEARQAINEMCRRGVLVGLTGPDRRARNILKIRPPLVFNEKNLDQLITTLDEVLTALSTGHGLPASAGDTARRL